MNGAPGWPSKTLAVGGLVLVCLLVSKPRYGKHSSRPLFSCYRQRRQSECHDNSPARVSSRTGEYVTRKRRVHSAVGLAARCLDRLQGVGRVSSWSTRERTHIEIANPSGLSLFCSLYVNEAGSTGRCDDVRPCKSAAFVRGPQVRTFRPCARASSARGFDQSEGA